MQDTQFKHYRIDRGFKVLLDSTLKGSILDIGGGGEGIIGRLYNEQVIAIDNRQEELDEAPEGFQKVLMDATKLQYEDNVFDNITCFFSLMFMDSKEQKLAIEEAARVLKPGGELHIWDCDITTAYPEPFCIDLVIQMPKEIVATTYGVGKEDSQNRETITNMCIDSGLHFVCQDVGEKSFYLKFRK